MLFNIIAASLTWQAWLARPDPLYVSYESFCLSIADILPALVLLVYLRMREKPYRFILLIAALYYDLIYSSLAIGYYVNRRAVDQQYANMTLAVIILNCLALIGSIVQHHLFPQRETATVPQPSRDLALA